MQLAQEQLAPDPNHPPPPCKLTGAAAHHIPGENAELLGVEGQGSGT